jgi:hypothetical protein
VQAEEGEDILRDVREQSRAVGRRRGVQGRIDLLQLLADGGLFKQEACVQLEGPSTSRCRRIPLR